MSARRKGKRGRKRKQPDSFNDDDTNEPKPKKRKLALRHNKRTTKTKDDKSHSEEPQIANHTSDPFKNTVIPTVSFNIQNRQSTRRYSHPYKEDEGESSDHESTSPESHYTKHHIMRSQPSTPLRYNIKKAEPHSQSAKRHKKYTNNYTKISPIHNLRTSLYTKPRNITNQTLKEPERKHIPNLLCPQDSISFSPRTQSPHKRQIKIPVTQTPLRRNINKHTKKDNENIWQIVLFALIGFIVGFIVAISVYHENKLESHGRNPKIITIKEVDSCTCDITRNTSSILCRPCMDQYWSLKSQYTLCDEQQISIKKDIDTLRREKEELLIRYRALVNHDDAYDSSCGEYKDVISILQHNLGECNVEWGSCEQLGRQKDKLDEKRMEEIDKHKRKFSLCNEQLKRYKENVKRNKNR